MYNIFLFILLQSIAFVAAQDAKIDKILDEELAVAGIITQASIIKYKKVYKMAGSCEITYQYTVNSYTFTNKEIAFCDQKNGDSIFIEYLPHQPTKSRITGNKNYIYGKRMSIIFSSLGWLFICLRLVEFNIFLLKNQKS